MQNKTFMVWKFISILNSDYHIGNQ